MEPTHILQIYHSPGRKDSIEGEKLYRADSGMLVGIRKDAVVVFGIDPNKRQGRSFIDAGRAAMFLENEVPKLDLAEHFGAGEPHVKREDLNVGLIVMTGETVQMPGGLRPF